MLRIYKYKVSDFEGGCVSAPVVNWLNIDWQDHDGYVAWALVDLNRKDRLFRFIGFMTGEDCGTTLDGYQYLGTVTNRGFVLHFFVAELNPDNKEVMIEEDNLNKIEDFKHEIDKNFTWNSDYLKWLEDLDSVKENDINNFYVETDWTYRPELGVQY